MPVLVIDDLKILKPAALRFLKETEGKRIFAFYGAMGAGKTTFIRAICEQLGSIDTVTSPTFTIINEYFTSSGESLYHFDFYRIEKAEEVLDIGFDEYLDSGRSCFIEWPEKIEHYLPDNVIRVKITVGDDMTRFIELE